MVDHQKYHAACAADEFLSSALVRVYGKKASTMRYLHDQWTDGELIRLRTMKVNADAAWIAEMRSTKSEPETQSHLAYCRDLISNVVIPPEGSDWVDANGKSHSYRCGLNPDPDAMKHMVSYCTCSTFAKESEQ